jgi:hypothetical protein
MKIHRCAQRSEEWFRLRLAIPTASEMHRIICPSEGAIYRCETCGTEYPRSRKKCGECKGPDVGTLVSVPVAKLSGQQEGYMNRLLAEWYQGAPLMDPQSMYQSEWMSRGEDLEPFAVKAFEFETGLKTEEVGFVSLDSGLLGCSPDRLVLNDSGEIVAGLEIKSSSPAVHMGHMVKRAIDGDHYPQVQAGMLICELPDWYVMSYCPSYPSVIIKCPRDEGYIGLMDQALRDFWTKTTRARALIIQEYGEPARPEPPAEPEDGLNISDEDVAAIFAASRQPKEQPSADW